MRARSSTSLRSTMSTSGPGPVPPTTAARPSSRIGPSCACVTEPAIDSATAMPHAAPCSLRAALRVVVMIVLAPLHGLGAAARDRPPLEQERQELAGHVQLANRQQVQLLVQLRAQGLRRRRATGTSRTRLLLHLD